MSYSVLEVDLKDGVAQVRLNRPAKANAMDRAVWEEIRSAFEWVDATPEARVVILSGNGKHFCSGIDLAMLAGARAAIQDECSGRMSEKLRRQILNLQDCLTSVERCRKPVLAAIQGACVGGGVDLICCCDMRYCAADAYFSIKEIDIGMTADAGTLQRLPRLIGDGMARELAYTGRNLTAAEAKDIGLVNRVFITVEEMATGVADIAAAIAAKSPLAVRGAKEMLVYARDHPVAESLNHVATWNAAMLLSSDLDEALAATLEKRAPHFRD
jgi:enoyl-CoA hydratase